MQSIKVTQFQRKPQAGEISMERCFQEINKHLSSNILIYMYTAKYASRGIIKRILNYLLSIFHQNQINHITGEMHYLGLGMKRNRTIITFHDCTPIWAWRDHKWRQMFHWLFWYYLPISWCRYIVAISEFTKKELIRYTNCDPRKINIINDPLLEGCVRKSKVFNEKNPIILFVGTAERKNLHEAIQALKNIKCRLRIIGEINSDQKNDLKMNNIDYSNVFNISDKQMIEEYKKCDILLFVSLYEGFGMPIIEANAIGRPVVTSNICSMPEVAGNAAVYVNPKSPASIRKGVINIIQNKKLRKKLVEHGYINARRFNPKIIAGEYEQLYREVSGARRI